MKLVVYWGQEHIQHSLISFSKFNKSVKYAINNIRL